MKFLNFLLIIFLSFFLDSCSQKPARVVNRSKVVYSRNSEIVKEKYKNNLSDSELKYSQTEKEDNRQKNSDNLAKKTNKIEVAVGDNLYSIARKHQLVIRDLIKENNLTPPYNLKVGDTLKVPNATYHEVKSGETIYSIARSYDMKVDSLVELNDFKKPYQLKVGEKIKVSKIATKPDSQEIKIATNKNDEIKLKKIKEDDKKSLDQEEGVVEKTLNKLNKFTWPINGQIISKFGPKKGGLYNDGINIKAKEGTKIKASEDGVVAYVGNELKGYGNLIIVKHSFGWISAYAHLNKFLVKKGQKISKGDLIGEVGATGNVDFPQLYFGLRKGRDAVNPQNYLKK